MIETPYAGLYKGVVVDIHDPEYRKRVRVRVPSVHGLLRPDDACPWAEICYLGSKLSGIFHSYAVNDQVWVMFEGGDPNYPIVVGARNTYSVGAPDTPVSHMDPDTGDLRWTFVDRKGNTIELIEAGDGVGVRIKSGQAEIRVSQSENEIVISSTEGNVRVESQRAVVVSGRAEIKAGAVDIAAENFNSVGLDNGSVVVESNDRVEISAQDLTTGAFGEVAIGGAGRRILGVTVPPGTPIGNTIPKQTPKTSIRGRVINIGGGLGGSVPTPLSNAPSPVPTDPAVDGMMDFDGFATLLPTLTINLRSTGKININCAGPVSIQGSMLEATVLGGMAKVTAPLVELSAVAQLKLAAVGKVDITGSMINLSTGA